MSYEDAIAWLKENNYKKEDGTFYEIGEDIPEVGIIVAPSIGRNNCCTIPRLEILLLQVEI